MDESELRAILRNPILPPTGPLLLALAGFVVASTRRFQKHGIALLVGGILLLWALATPAIAGLMVRGFESRDVLDLSRPVAADAVVILGGGTRRYAPEYGGPAPNQLTLQRLAYGARVARATGLPVLVTGGGAEGAAMAEFLRRDFVLEPRWVEDRARNTHENALFSAQILRESGLRRVVLVTSALQMRRAAGEFEAQGLEVIAAPVGVSSGRQGGLSDWVPGIAALRESHYVLYELLGELVRSVR